MTRRKAKMIVLSLTVGLLIIGFGLMSVGVSGIEQGSNRAGTITAAKNDLLDRMYHARELPTMGGREVWLDLLDMYYTGSWDEMIETISLFTGPGGRTRQTCLRDLKIIKEEN